MRITWSNVCGRRWGEASRGLAARSSSSRESPAATWLAIGNRLEQPNAGDLCGLDMRSSHLVGLLVRGRLLAGRYALWGRNLPCYAAYADRIIIAGPLTLTCQAASRTVGLGTAQDRGGSNG